VLEICKWMQETWLSRAIAESVWGYPIIGAIHVLGIALFGGAVLMTDVCALGFAMRRTSAEEIARRFRDWKRIGLCVMTVTGILLFWSAPVRYYDRVSFRIKIVLLLCVAANGWILRSKLQRVSAWLSLVFWVAIIFASRGIAFF
jgi:hypothetical protein